MPPSLYASYILEREGKNILETDKGFATYSFIKDGCYIEEIYILPQYRKTGEASTLTDQIAEIARQNGHKKLFGSVCPSAAGSTNSLRALIAYGFKLDSSTNNFIWLTMDIGA